MGSTMDGSKAFTGKLVAVTGAAHGIGLATVNWLVSRGATVAMADNASHPLEKAAEKISQQFPTQSSLIRLSMSGTRSRSRPGSRQPRKLLVELIVV